jgi:hypothetical protein
LFFFLSIFKTAPGEYTTTVKFADKHTDGFCASIIGSQSEICLGVTEMDIHDLNATLRSLSGFNESRD